MAGSALSLSAPSIPVLGNSAPHSAPWTVAGGGHPKTISHRLLPAPNPFSSFQFPIASSSFQLGLSSGPLDASWRSWRRLMKGSAPSLPVPILGRFWGWVATGCCGAPWAVCGQHPKIPSPSPLSCSKSILSSRRWKRPMEGSGAALSLPASSSPFLEIWGWVGAGCFLWCRVCKTIFPSPLPYSKSTFSRQAWALGLWIPHGRAAGDPELLSPKSAPALGFQLQIWGWPHLVWGGGELPPSSAASLSHLKSLDPSGILGVLSTLGSWSWVTSGAWRCPHVTPHGWPCQRVPRELFSQIPGAFPGIPGRKRRVLEPL